MTEKRFALIIASYQYQDTDLRQLVAPAQDAEDLGRALEDAAIGGFEVQTLLNTPSYKVNRQIEAFFADRRRDDLLLLYFSGHGIKDEDGLLYFATADTQRKLLRSTAVSANFVNDVMRRSRSRRQVLLLDCCYSGAFARGMVARADKAIGTRERFEGRGRVVLTASDAMQYSFEGDDITGEGVRSVFTRILVHGMETGQADLNGDGRISLDELYDYVYKRVADETPQQRPRKWAFDVQGEIIIARNPAPPAPKVLLPGWVPEALASGAFSARMAAVAELAQLSQGEDQALATVARAEIERLSREDEDRTVRGAAAGALGISPMAAGDRLPLAPPLPVAVEKAEPEPEPELHPNLALKLSVKPQTVGTGGEAKWTVTLRNDGDDDLHQVTVRRGRTLLDEPFDLAAGKGRRFTFTTTYETAGKKTESVTTTGIASSGESVRDEASASVQVRLAPPVPPQAKPAPKRKPQIRPTLEPRTVTSPIRPLSPWNPLDHLRLLWWVLVTPQQLKDYRQALGGTDERRVGKWLASTLAWLPLLIPILALGLEALPRPEEVASPAIYFWLSGGLILAWLLTGWFGGKEVEGWEGWVAALLMGGAASVVGGGVAVLVAGGLAGSVVGLAPVSVTTRVMIGVAVWVAVLVAGGVANGIAGSMASCVVLGVVFGVAGGVMFDVGEAAGIAGDIIAEGVMLFIMGGTMGLIPFISIVPRTAERLETGHPSWGARAALGVLLLAYAFIIWFSFLDGWRVFQ